MPHSKEKRKLFISSNACGRLAAAAAVLLVAAVLSSCGGGGRTDPVNTTGNFSPGDPTLHAFGIAVTDDGREVYLPDNVTGKLIWMDGATLAPMSSLRLVTRAYYASYVPEEKWLLVSHVQSQGKNANNEDVAYQKFTVFDTVEKKILLEIDLQDEAAGRYAMNTKSFVYGPTIQKAYVISGSNNSVVVDMSQVDSAATATVTALSGITTSSSEYFGSALSDDESRLYISKRNCTDATTCSSTGNEIKVYQTATDTEVTSISPITLSGCTNPTHLAYDGDRTRLYVTCTNTSKVVSVEFLQDTTLGTSPKQCHSVSVGEQSFPSWISLSPDGKYIFVSNTAKDTVTMLEAASMSVVNVYGTGDFPDGNAVYPPYLYVTNAMNGSVTKIAYEPDEYTTVPSFSSGSATNRIVFERDYDGDGRYEIYLMNTDVATDAQCALQIPTAGDFNTQPVWNSGKSKLVFAAGDSENDTDLYVYTTSSGDLEKLTSGLSYVDMWPSVALSGTNVQDRVVFSRYSAADGDWELYSIKLDGTQLTRLTNNSVDDIMPSWYVYSGSEKIFFVRVEGGNRNLYVMDSSGDNATQLTSTAANETLPAPSPSAAKLLYVSSAGSDHFGTDTEIYVADITIDGDGNVTGLTNQTALTSSAAMDTNPSWVSGGASMIFLSGRDDTGGEIYKADLSISAAPYSVSTTTRLTNDNYDDRYPAGMKK